MDLQGGNGTIVGSHPEDSKFVKVDDYFDKKQKNLTYATLGQIIHAKQKKYNSINQLPERFVHRPHLVGYDPDQPDDEDNMGYYTGSSSQIVQASKAAKLGVMTANIQTDKIIGGGLKSVVNRTNNYRNIN